MTVPVFDLGGGSAEGQSNNKPARRGLSGPASVPVFDLADSTIYKDNEEATGDILARMYGSSTTAPAVEPKRGLMQRIDEGITNVFGTNQASPEEVDQEGVKRVRLENAADQQRISARRAELGTSDKDRGYLMKTFDSAAAGLANITGSTAEFVGRQTGAKWLEDLGKKAQIDAAALTPEDQDLLQKVVGGIGSMLPTAAAGLGGAAAAGVLGAGRAGMALAGALAGTAAEAPSIGQEAYEGALKNTGNEAVAERQGYKAIAYNLPLTFITNKLGYFAEGGGRLAQTAKTFAFEGAQEGSQKVLTNVMGYEPTGQGVSEEALVGGLAGGALKAATYSSPEQPGTPGDLMNKPPAQGAGTDEERTPDQRITAEERPALSWFETHQTLQAKPSLLAVLREDAQTDEQREIIDRAIARSEVMDQVEQAAADPRLLLDTRKELDSEAGQQFLADLQSSLGAYANEMPPAGVFKVPAPNLETNISWDEMWQSTDYVSQVEQELENFKAERDARQMQVRKPAQPAPQEPAAATEPETAVEAVEPSEPQFDTEALAQGLSVRKGPSTASQPDDLSQATTPDGNLPPMTEDNRAGYEAFFAGRGSEIRGIPNEGVRASGMQRAMRQMQQVGFTEQEAQEILNTEDPVNTVSGRQGSFENVSTSMAAEFGEPVENFQPTKPPKYFTKIGQLFGVNVVAYNYTGKNGEIRKKAGRYMPNQGGRGTVALNLTTSDQAALFVLGHEVFHDLERRFPTEAKQLAQEIKSYLSNTAYNRYKSYYEREGQAQRTDSEIAADVMGTMFTDRKFWEQLGQRNPTLLERVLQVLDTVLASFRSNAKSSRQQIGKELAQFDKVRSMMAELASKGIEQTATGRVRPAAQQDIVSDMDEIPASGDDDAKTLDRVMNLLREGNVPAAARTFKQANLYGKGFGSFADIQRMATQPAAAPAPSPAPAPAPAPATAPRPALQETGPSEEDIEGVTFVQDPPPKKGSRRKAAPSDVRVEAAPASMGLPTSFEQSGGRRLDPGGTETSPVERELEAPNLFESRPGMQYSLGLGRFTRDWKSDSQKRLHETLNDLFRQFTRPKFFEDTVLLLQRQITEIDQKLAELRTLDVDGKKFRAVDESDEAPGLWGTYDENAYDRLEQGFRPDKPTTKDELTAARRKLTEELQAVRDKSTAAKARTFMLGRARLLDETFRQVDIATARGMKREKAMEVANPFLRSLMFDNNKNTREQILEVQSEQINAERQAAEEMFDIPMQEDAFDGARVAMGLVSDLRAKKITSRELDGFIQRGLREKDFTVTDVANAFRAFKMDVPRSVLDVSGQLAFRKTLDQHLSESGNATHARMEWLTSLDNILSVTPGVRGRFSPQELDLYDQQFALRNSLAGRRTKTEDMAEADTAESAFPRLLFVNYNLATATRSADLNRLLGGDAREAWMQDVAYALRRRPDLADSIFEQLGDDKSAFDAWVQQKKDAIRQESEMLAKAPGFLELRNLDVADAILKSAPMRSRVDGAPDTRPSELEQVYVTLANAEQQQLPAVLDAISKVKSIIQSGIDMETGEIFQSQSQAEQAAADFIESVYANAALVAPARSNLGARLQEDIGFGMTVEEAGERDRGLPEQSFETDQSLEELQNAGLVTEAEAEGFSTLERVGDEDSDLAGEEGAGADQDIAAEEAQESTFAGIPGALRGDTQYRFRRGFFRGDLVPAVVSEHLAKISTRWQGAPNIRVVPNVASLPQELREKVMAKLGTNYYAKGLYMDGDVFVFSDHAESLIDAEFTLFHEVEGHFGMRAFMGADFDAYLDRLYKTNPEIRRAADAKMAEELMGPLEAVDEVLADMQMDGRNAGMFQAYIGKVIAGLRKIGMERVAGWIASKGNFEVAYLLRGAKRAVREGRRPFNGAPEDLRLAAAKTPYEVFAAKDGKTVAYARYNPVLDRWSLFTARGDNIRDSFKTEIVKDYEEVVTKMRRLGRLERRTRSGVYIDNKIPTDLVKIPDFRLYMEDANFTSREGLKTAWQVARRNSTIWFQNEYYAAFEVFNHLERMGRIRPEFDIRPELEGVAERRTAAKLEDYRKNLERPLMRLVQKFGNEGGNKTLGEAFPELADRLADKRLLDYSLLDMYLGARHAHERNAKIAEINKNQPDGGSGIFDADADLILNAVGKEPYSGTLAHITNMLQQLSAVKLTEMKESGMIGREEFEKRSQYDYYVNLSGINENIDQFDNPAILAGGPKFGTKKDKRAMGRGDAASDVLVRTLQSFESAIIHAEKNKVKQKMLAAFEINYDPDFVVINKVAMKRNLEKVVADGEERMEVVEGVDPNYIRNKDVMVVHVKGRPITMEFKQKGPGSFSEAVNGMIYPPDSLGLFLRASQKFNRYLGQLLTTMNPVWGVINYARDTQHLMSVMAADKRFTPAMQAKAFSYLKGARKAAFHVATDGKRGKNADQAMIDAYNEMRRFGGATSYLNLRGLDQQVEELQDMLEGINKPETMREAVSHLTKNPLTAKVYKDLAVKVGEVVEAFNVPLEMAPRIATYRILTESGYTREEAARVAGDITVNFNMRGSSQLMRSLFLFFNPAVQGTERMFRLAKTNPKGMAKVAAGWAVLGMFANMIARELGGEDEEGEDKLDSVPVGKRSTFMVLFPGVPFGAIPIPYGWNAMYSFGTFLMDGVLGKQSADTVTKRIASSTFEAFSPLGGALGDASSTGIGVAKMFTPTVLSPLADVFIYNENRFGAPIMKEAGMFGGAKISDSHLNFDSASPLSTAALRGLNRLTGGDRVNPGVLDFNPSAFDYMVSSYMPGVPTEVYRSISLAMKKAQGYETKDMPLPLVDRLTAKPREAEDFARFRRAQEFIKTRIEDYKMNPENREKILREYPALGGADALINSVNYQLNQLRQQRNALQTPQADGMTEREKVDLYNRERAAEKELMSRAVKRLLETNPEMRKVILAND